MSMISIERGDQHDNFGQVDYRRILTLRALDHVEKLITETKELSIEEAAGLGSLYLAYFTELLLHGEDYMMILRERLGRQQGEPLLLDVRMRWEAALFEAQRGDWAPLRENLLGVAKRSILYNSRQGQEFGRKLLVIVNLIPDSWEPFKPPLPVWLDPQFAPGQV